jgi:predicted O-methyltransferase YrrM
MSTRLLMRAARKACTVAAHWKLNLLMAPFYLRFQMRGHGHPWCIFTHMTRLERLLLYRLGLRQPAGAVLLEVGSYLGASACFLAAAAQEIGGQVHCVDTWRNEGMSEGFRDTWQEFRTNTERYASLIIPHRGRSVDVAGAFNGRLDLLFIDGDHSYEGCRSDALAWLPHLKPGGIIVMHDYDCAEGVQRVVAELIRPQQRDRGHILQHTYWARM